MRKVIVLMALFISITFVERASALIWICDGGTLMVSNGQGLWTVGSCSGNWVCSSGAVMYSGDLTNVDQSLSTNLQSILVKIPNTAKFNSVSNKTTSSRVMKTIGSSKTVNVKIDYKKLPDNLVKFLQSIDKPKTK